MAARNLFATVLIVLLGLVVFAMVRPYVVAIISAIVLAVLFLPLHKKLSKFLPAWISAFLLTTIPILAGFALLTYVGYEALGQAQTYLADETPRSLIDAAEDQIPSSLDQFSGYLVTISNQVRSIAVNLSVSFISNIPVIAIGIIITLITTYYLILNWNPFYAYVESVVPFKNRRAVLERVGASSRQIVYGYSIIAFLDFLVAAIGFWIAGLELYLFLALIIGVAAFVPFLGPIAIWLPAFIIMLLQGDYFAAIVILITGLVLSLIVDNWLVFVLVGNRSDINPVFMLLGVVGGVAIFGPFGFIVGPLFLVAFREFLREYAKEEI